MAVPPSQHPPSKEPTTNRSTLGEWFFSFFDLFDLVEILFGFLRVVGHVVVVVIRAILHH